MFKTSIKNIKRKYYSVMCDHYYKKLMTLYVDKYVNKSLDKYNEAHAKHEYYYSKWCEIVGVETI